ncbi:MAG: hypothetical protein ACTSYL_08015 [Candidatus Thorarchaeota archaeon]
MVESVSVLIASTQAELVALLHGMSQEIASVDVVRTITTKREIHDKISMADYDIILIDGTSPAFDLLQESSTLLFGRSCVNVVLVGSFTPSMDSSSIYQIQNFTWLQDPLDSTDGQTRFRTQLEQIVQAVIERKDRLHQKLLRLIDDMSFPAGIWTVNRGHEIYLEDFNDPLIFRANELGYSLDDSSLTMLSQIGLEEVGSAIRLTLADGVP